MLCECVFFQAEDGIRDLVRSRGLGDVYKRQAMRVAGGAGFSKHLGIERFARDARAGFVIAPTSDCLLYTSDAADERSSVDLGGRRIIKKKRQVIDSGQRTRSSTHRITATRSSDVVRE